MRILHFSDLHLGVESFGRLDPATGESTRLGDFLAALDEVVSYALEGEIDLVLFCGDAYKSRDPSQTHQREFARRIARLTGGGVPVYLLAGNHDVAQAKGSASAVDIFQTLAVPLVYVGSRMETQIVATRRGGPVQVVGIPWINRSWLLAQEQREHVPPGAPLNELLELKLHEVLGARCAALDPDLPAVLAGHLTLAEAARGSEKRMTVGADPVFLSATLQEHAVVPDYIALGHVHTPQVIQGRQRPLVYSGSLVKMDFSEEDEQKGFRVVEIDPGRPAGERLRSFEAVLVQSRRFVTIDVHSTDGNPTADALNTISSREREIDGAIVRVRVTLAGASTSADLDEAAVRRALASAHYIAGVSREAEGSRHIRLGDVRIGELGPMDALALYFQSRGVAEERSAVLLEYGRRLYEVEEQRTGGTEEHRPGDPADQGSGGPGEERKRGAEEQRNTGTGEQRGHGEQGGNGSAGEGGSWFR